MHLWTYNTLLIIFLEVLNVTKWFLPVSVCMVWVCSHYLMYTNSLYPILWYSSVHNYTHHTTRYNTHWIPDNDWPPFIADRNCNNSSYNADTDIAHVHQMMFIMHRVALLLLMCTVSYCYSTIIGPLYYMWVIV